MKSQREPLLRATPFTRIARTRDLHHVTLGSFGFGGRRWSEVEKEVVRRWRSGKIVQMVQGDGGGAATSRNGGLVRMVTVGAWSELGFIVCRGQRR
jgi:hypothetical protein